MMKAKMFFMSLVTLVVALSFTGCSKDDDEFNLAGTEWIYEEQFGTNTSITVTFIFNTAVDVMMRVQVVENGIVTTDTERGSYIYSEPYVEIFFDDYINSLRGPITDNGKYMDLTDTSDGSQWYGTFIRQ